MGITLTPALLEACGSSSSAGTSVGGNFDGQTLTLLGIDGEDAKKEAQAWRDSHKLTYQPTYFAADDELFSRLRTGQSFDLAIVPNPYMQPMIKAGLLKPLDLSRIPANGDLWPNLQNADWKRDAKGNVYGMQILWGDGPFVYNPAKVPNPPTRIVELTLPLWKHRLINFDDPANPFMMMGRALGFDQAPNFTMSQLAETAQACIPIVKNTVAFAQGYPDGADYLVRGEADLCVSGWEAQLNMAAQKGVKLAYSFFFEADGGGWSDSLAIPITATHIDAAYGYINALLSPPINALNAQDSLSGCTNSKALSLITGQDATLYDYAAVKTPNSKLKFENWLAPVSPPPGIASRSDWNAAWTQVKAQASS
jgi:spermidine/putrescine-binding protein